MKYLELEGINQIAGDLLRIEETVKGLNIRLEAYSLKKTRKERKDSKSSKYLSIASMVAAALNMTFFEYEIDLAQKDMKVVPEVEAKSLLTSKMFTLGITKDYSEMVQWVDRVFEGTKTATGKDRKILRLNKPIGPFERSLWSECLVFYGREMKRIILFVTLYQKNTHSPNL
ncbi:hypothetical protein NEDG_01188 [Nematocida displodere]|uniref:Uncharacterized protein n=1 Tax=Nematocida displodere TaxID=1805483 RepID=A0A177EDH8_9MICR|nr:hypothetical protein NEDG_01188 [Nematocida displodere]